MRFVLFLLLCNVLYAEGVPAGTKIENTATLNYVIDGVDFSVNSNKVVDVVDQKIDMSIVCQESEVVIVGVSEKKRALAFRLSNRGNGADVYEFSTITGEKKDFLVENKEVYVDDGDGLFSAVTDSLVQEVNLSIDESKTLFFVSDIPQSAEGVSSNGFKIHSKLQENLNFGESRKVSKYYVVMASKEDALSDFCSYEVSNLGIELEKSATLSSDKLYAGTTIHYNIALKVLGRGVVNDVVISDALPNGTVYIENSLKLDGVTFGDFNGTAINVPIGEVEQLVESSEVKHLVTFDAKVL
jgi:uncharacterized repeat protein (TIGR01451 family)